MQKECIAPYTVLLVIFIGIFMNACNRSSSSQNTFQDSIVISKEELLDTTFLTKELQNRLTPDTVLNILRERNLEYMKDNLTIRNTSQRIRTASLGQYPAAVVLSCLDSRVPVEDVFHSGIGDLFVARVAGNIANEDILGSLEYGCKVSGAKVIIVLGHEHCGAIKAAIDNFKLGNISALLAKIQPAIVQVADFNGEKKSNNPAYVDAVTKANIFQTLQKIRNESAILKDMEAKHQIRMIGAEYHMETGEVEFLSENQ